MTLFDLPLYLFLSVFLFWIYRETKLETDSRFEDGTGGDKPLSSISLGFSLFGTYISSIALFAFTGKAFGGSWQTVLYSFAILPAALAAGWFYLPQLRKNKHDSCYNFIEKNLGAKVDKLCSITSIFLQICRVGIIVYLLTTGFKLFFPIHQTFLSVLLVFFVVYYSSRGGFRAIVKTDLLQALVFLIATLALLYILLDKLNFDFLNIFTVLKQKEKLQLYDSLFSLQKPSVFAVLLFGFLQTFKTFSASQVNVQRIMAASSTQSAQRALILGSVMVILSTLLLTFLGSCLYVFYLQTSTPLNLANDQVLPFFIAQELPFSMKLVMALGILGAAMSSIDSSLHASSTLFLHSLYPRLLDKENKMRSFTKTNFGFGLLALLFSLALPHLNSILNFWWLISSLLGSIILGLLLLSLQKKVISQKHLNASVILGLGTGIALFFFFELYGPLLGVCSALSILLYGCLFLNLAHLKKFKTFHFFDRNPQN